MAGLEKKKILILFDIDGTLLLTGGAGNRSIDLVIESLFSIKKATESIEFVGRTDRFIFQEIADEKLNRPVSDDMIDKIRRLYAERLKEEVEMSTGFRVLPGVKALLKKLSASSRIVLGIATGNVKEGAEIKLKRAGIDHYFSFGGFDEDGRKRSEIVLAAIKKALDLFPEGFERIYLVGDSPYDVLAAREAGILSIAVGTDGRDTYGLKRALPDFYFPHLENASDFLNIIIQ